MKHILFYTDTPMLGGAENQMYLLAKYLPADKYKITLACASNKKLNSWCKQFLDIGANVLRLKVFHKHDPRHYLYLRKILPRFDLMHMHVWNPGSCRYGFLAARGLPLVITEHDPFRLNRLKTWIKRKLISRAAAIITTSKAAKELVVLHHPHVADRVCIVNNGIDMEAWRAEAVLENKNEFRRTHFNAAPLDKVIICVAELHERKGQKYLIDAFKRIADELPNAKLVFVGDGLRKKYYEKLSRPLLENRILFLGRKRDVAKCMAAADLFVLPSIREAFGLVLLEAAIAGVPIIATRVGGIPEIIENGVSGLLVPSENPDELAKNMARVLNDDMLGFALKKAAKDRVETCFGVQEMANKTAEIYDMLLHIS